MRFNRFNGGWVLCTGTYFASRIVVTRRALPQTDAIPGQGFDYFGDDYLTDVESLPVIPEPGSRSKWARVETTAAHPDYDASINYPTSRSCTWTASAVRADPAAPRSGDRLHKKGEIAGWGGTRR